MRPRSEETDVTAGRTIRAAAHLQPAVLALLAAAPAAAQTLTVQNLAPFPRREVAAVVVPFAQGKVAAVPSLHVPREPTAWQPFGARWPDGSLRQALCLFAVELPALGETTVTLAAGDGPAPPAGEISMPAAELRVEA